jgi:hypothetical protein
VNRDRNQNWDSERWVIDQLIDAVDAGEGLVKLKYGRRLCEGQASLDWHSGRLIDVGKFTPFIKSNTRLSEDDVELLEMTDVISETRLGSLRGGARMTPDELHEWRRLRAEYDLDPSSGSVWAVMEVRHSDRRRRAYIAMTGRGPREADLDVEVYVNCDGLRTRPRAEFEWSFVAAYSSYTEALNAVKSVGYTSIADYIQRRAHETDRS